MKLKENTQENGKFSGEGDKDTAESLTMLLALSLSRKFQTGSFGLQVRLCEKEMVIEGLAERET